MQTYKVKSGDTKTSLKAKFGIDLNDAQYRSSDPNKLFAGETLSIAPRQSSSSSVISGNTVDLSKVVTDKKPTGQVSSSLRDLSVGFSPNATDEQLQEISDRDPELGDKIMNKKGFSGAPQEFVSTSFEDADPKTRLTREADALNTQIQTLEERIANKSTNRDDALNDAGVFEDLQELNELKAKQREAEDREIEIGIEGRQELRGKQATKTEFDASTRPARENNVLDQLAASRATSRLTDAINTNIAVIDSKLDAQFERDTFIHTQKIKRLEKVEKTHADIITAEQANLLENRKFQQQLILKGVEFENGLKKDFLKDLANLGIGDVDLSKAINGSLQDVMQLRSDKMNVKNWSNISTMQGIQTFTGDQLDRFIQYKEVQDTISAEEQAIIDTNGALMTYSENVVGIIENMLNNQVGLPDVTGGGLFGFGRANFFEDPDSMKFLNDANNLIPALALKSLQDAIANGATFGALSDAELTLVANASNNLGADMKDGKVTGFASGEQELVNNLEILQLAQMKNFLKASGQGPDNLSKMSAYNDDGTKNQAVYDTIKDLYKAAKSNPSAVNSGTNSAASEIGEDGNLVPTLELLKQEEGFRSEAYLDSTGTPTIGFGTTTINGQAVKLGDTISEENAQALMQEQVINNYTTFADQVTADIAPHQFAALTSFEYNLGPGVWNDVTGQQILAFINAGQLEDAAQLMQLYNKSRDANTGNLVVNNVLRGRRAREAQLLLA